MTKETIDSATYEQLLRAWRFAPVGDPTFQGEMGEYFSRAFIKAKTQHTNEERVAISKKIGW